MKTLNETLKEFENNGICKDHTNERFQTVLDFQDIIGRSTIHDIMDSFMAMDKHQRGIFLFAACNCLNKDTFLHILKTSICDSIIYEEETRLNNEHDKRMADIIEREKHMDILEAENRTMKETIDALKENNTMAKNTILGLTTKADKYDKIRSLLN